DARTASLSMPRVSGAWTHRTCPASEALSAARFRFGRLVASSRAVFGASEPSPPRAGLPTALPGLGGVRLRHVPGGGRPDAPCLRAHWLRGGGGGAARSRPSSERPGAAPCSSP